MSSNTSLLLAVNPGWGGQKYIPSTTARIARVQRMIADSGKNIILGVDGGITKENIAEVAATGADLIVTGSAVFDGKTPEANARFMLDAVAAVHKQPECSAGYAFRWAHTTTCRAKQVGSRSLVKRLRPRRLGVAAATAFLVQILSDSRSNRRKAVVLPPHSKALHAFDSRWRAQGS